MLKRLVALTALSVSALAADITSDDPRLKASFPDGAGWSEVTHQEIPVPQGAGHVWSARNAAEALALGVIVIKSTPTTRRPPFKKHAEEWALGMLDNGGKKISARFTTLAGHEAYELVTSRGTAQKSQLFSSTMIQVGDVTYTATIIADDTAQLTGKTARTFLNSVKVPK